MGYLRNSDYCYYDYIILSESTREGLRRETIAKFRKGYVCLGAPFIGTGGYLNQAMEKKVL